MGNRVGFGALWACAVIVSCVGDSTTVNDGGADATNDQFALDTGTSDSADATAPKCDVNKPFGAPTMITAINQPGYTNGTNLTLTGDGLTGYFNTNSLADSGDLNNHLFSVTRTTTAMQFATPIHLTELDTSGGEGRSSVTADGLQIFFGVQAGINANVGIDFATRSSTAAKFGAPAALQNVDTGNAEAHPFIRADAQVLYFDRTPPSGDEDLYLSSWTGSAFTAGKAITELNTVGTADAFPTVTPDDLVIYYSSNRTDGGAKGSYDVWVATRTSVNDPWGQPRNVAELNTPDPEKMSFITSDLCTIYFFRQYPSDAGQQV